MKREKTKKKIMRGGLYTGDILKKLDALCCLDLLSLLTELKIKHLLLFLSLSFVALSLILSLHSFFKGIEQLLF